MTDNADKFIDTANEELDAASEEPMALGEYVDELLDDPRIGASSHQYLLNAIDYYGTRTVIEKGEEIERYCFFDDPANNGEHAVLGNTEMLNEFVRDLRAVASSEERMQKIILFTGPTATGKSELKRCIINGLREYSKEQEGRRYTCEWNISSLSDTSGGLNYGTETESTDESEWFTSPVQTTPLSVFPQNVRDDIQSQVDQKIPTEISLDPFSQEAYDTLQRYYQNSGSNDIFSQITDPKHLRIRRYVMDETMGIGVLTAEDDGSVKQRLVGDWMPSMFQVLDSRGRKNPQAFSYDGVLAQGNGGVTVVEDASKHVDLLVQLLNIPDESHAKIDKQIGFDVDTVPLFISNPDLQAQLDEHLRSGTSIKNIHSADPLKALKRRINQYDFRYLTELDSEVKLLRRELVGTNPSADTDPSVESPEIINDREFAPHTIEAAAMYNIVSRLTDEDFLKGGYNITDKALLYNRGYVESGTQRVYKDEFEVEGFEDDGTFGIPITYTRDILRGIAYDESETHLPTDVLDLLESNLESTPVFTEQEEKKFSDRVGVVKEYIHEKQETDVINAILEDRNVSEDAVSEYIEAVYEWENGGEADEDYDPLEMKLFEVDHLGMTDADYSNTEPSGKVTSFRQDRIVQPLNNYVWNKRGQEFEIDELPLREIPVLESLIGRYDWYDVFNQYEDFDPVSWDNPPENTETEAIKNKCIANMQEHFGYTEASARQTCERVVERARNSLTTIKSEQADD